MMWRYWLIFLLLTISSVYSLPVYQNGEFRQEGKIDTFERYSLSAFLPPVDQWYSLKITSSNATSEVFNDGKLSLFSFYLKKSRTGELTLTAPGLQIESVISLDFYCDPPVGELAIWIPFQSSFMKKRIEAVSNHFGIETVVEYHPDPAGDLYTRRLHSEQDPDIIIFPVSASQYYLGQKNESYPILFSAPYSINNNERGKPIRYPLYDKLLSEKILLEASRMSSEPVKLFFSSLKELSDRHMLSLVRGAADIVSGKNSKKGNKRISFRKFHHGLGEPEIDYALYLPQNRLSAIIFCSELTEKHLQQNIPESSGFETSGKDKVTGNDLTDLKEKVPLSLYHPAWEETLSLYINNLIPLDEALDKIK